ncbi:uncharacterized protein LOC141618386 [Silene latifolia]|uniref:uncharacterized protein LOC141618386 n=1 Tax=Silene latifolia TaxID=37657 RepID=UPI003D782425
MFVKSRQDVSLEIVHFSVDVTKPADLDELEEIYSSENEEIIGDEDDWSTDDEFINAQFYPDCRWKLSARYTKDYDCIQIRFFKDVHTCTRTMKNKRVHANFLAEEYQEKLLKHPTWKLKLFVKDVEDTYGVKVNRWQAGRAKRNTLSTCGKVVGRQYDSLRANIYEMKRSNVGSRAFLSLKPSISGSIPQFHMFYINFVAIRRNSLNGCRRLLGLDGAFLKGYCKGEILCAVGRDANNQMFPVAWDIIESESKESWSWFLGHLINDLEMQTGKGWTLISDQQKGLLLVIADMLPNAEHRLCARHIFTNWIKVIKGIPLHKLYWKAVKAYTEKHFNNIMEKLIQQSQRAHAQMCARDVTKFCHSFYKTWACTDVTSNYMAETFNSWILEAREKPILTMLEEIRRQVMSKMVEKKAEAIKCNGITTRVREKLNDFRQSTKNWISIEASTNVYEVQHTHNSTLSYTVRLDQKVCACRYWNLNGVSCEHATAAICAVNQNRESYVAVWYTKEMYKECYLLSLEPLNGQALWKTIEGGSILPSDPRVKCGRPSNKRKKAYGEVRQKPVKYRAPRSSKQLYSKCQKKWP